MSPPKPRRVAKSLPLPVRPAFRREFLDFERGIRMGNLEPHERITQIVKMHLAERYGQDFLIDKWGRGRYWQWICWLPRANRDAKPKSSGHSFASAKFFISLDRTRRELHAGLHSRDHIRPGGDQLRLIVGGKRDRPEIGGLGADGEPGGAPRLVAAVENRDSLVPQDFELPVYPSR